jgi:hypothetical protein
MNTTAVKPVIAMLLSELVHGAPSTGAYILNRGDPGMLRSLDGLSASAASTIVSGGSSIAAHVDHVRYGISLMNRWAHGENPWDSADWTASCSRVAVNEAEWAERRAQLRTEVERWLRAIPATRDVSETELAGMIGSVAHLAYHLGAIRQMDRSMRGPSAND